MKAVYCSRAIFLHYARTHGIDQEREIGADPDSIHLIICARSDCATRANILCDVKRRESVTLLESKTHRRRSLQRRFVPGLAARLSRVLGGISVDKKEIAV